MIHKNNFDFLRLVAATMVLGSHQFPLMGRPEPEWSGGSLGGLGVLVFFALSGYLVTGSWLRDPHLLRFAAKRFLRIWPGLAIVVLATALVLGPMVTTLDLRTYFRSAGTWDYLRNADLVHFVAYLPGVFTEGLPNSAVNGSLWTIPIEVACYAALAALGMIGLVRRRWAYLAVFVAAAFSFLCLSRVYGLPIDRMRWQLGVIFFEAGALCLFEAAWVRHRYAVLVTVLLLATWTWGSVLREAALTLALPVVVIVLGTACTPVLRSFGRFGDFSFGMYIYAFPVQQVVLLVSKGRMLLPAAFAVSFVVTLASAAASWYIVEKYALRMKRRLPARGDSRAAPHATADDVAAQRAASA